MKKVIFFCLLAITISYGQPAGEKDPAPQTSLSTTDTKIVNEAKNPTPPSQATSPVAQNPASSKPTTDKKTEEGTTNDTKAPTQTAQDNSTAKVAEKNATASATTAPEGKEKDKATSVKPENTTVPETKTSSSETPTTVPAVPTTVAPATTKSPDKKSNVEPVQARGFDGASFVGGIILTIGLLAISFFGYRYYKRRNTENYGIL